VIKLTDKKEDPESESQPEIETPTRSKAQWPFPFGHNPHHRLAGFDRHLAIIISLL
jgi:hypothetical protein